jgi:parallel beta-helix repeat protein
MKVHHCPASGIRVNRGDYVTIADSEVYSNTWWSSSAESAVVLAEGAHVDDVDWIKMRLVNNFVYDNVNKIPYYNPNYAWDYSPIGGQNCGSYPACEQELVEGCPWECRYGKKTQDYIVDGMGVYVTRNKDTYLHGQMELADNVAYGNGINGVVFHRTNRGVVQRNTVYDNGVVPRLEYPELVVEDWHVDLAKSRQPYSGIVINNAEGVKLWSNTVSSRYDDDYAFKIEADGTPPPLAAGGNNKVCKGLVDSNLDTVVAAAADPVVCGIAPVKYYEISCGSACHLIQWPYIMGNSYSPETAYEECEADCDGGDCKAFSLQDDYRPGNEGLKFCFLYKEAAEPSPESCADDPFNVQGAACAYSTQNGQFFVTPTAKETYNVNDLS